MNRIMKHTLQRMNVSHVTTSYYYPKGNSKMEQFHQILHNVMYKKVCDSLNNLGHLSKSGTTILTAYKSRRSWQFSVPRWIHLTTTITKFTIFRMGIITVFYKCKEISAKIYWLARNRGKTIVTWVQCYASLLGAEVMATWKKIILHSMKRIQLSL